MALQSAVFHLKAQIIYKLQDLTYQTEGLIPFREKLVQEMLEKVRSWTRGSFAVEAALEVCGEVLESK